MSDKIESALMADEWASALARDWRPDLHVPSHEQDRHAVAALCLYGQPFGFTQEDVTFLRELVEHSVDLSVGQCDSLDSIRDRIAALLPPVTP